MRWLYFIPVVLVILHAYAALTLGWNFPLSDWHGFRQTQTALSAYFISVGGPLIAYQTPVLGAPWSIPFEFPFYQWVVVLWENLSGLELNQSGRCVSILFYLLCFIPLNAILNLFKVKRIERLIFLCLFLCSPFYLFWSRTFLIESTALFFSLLYLSSALCWFDSQNKKHLLTALVSGIFGATIKGTTLGTPLVVVFLVGFIWSFKTKCLPQLFLWLIFFIGIPMLSAIAWTYYSDALKAEVPFAAFLDSKALNKWNFGTLGDRWSYHLWKEIIFDRATPEILGSNYSWIFLVVLSFFGWKRIKYALGFLALYLLTFLLFTNLHQVHNYYQYAQGVYLIIALGFLIVGCMERGGYRAGIGALGLIICLWFGYKGYDEKGFTEMIIKGRTSPYLEVGKVIKKTTEPEQVLLIYGLDWCSEVPYYSRRRAIMDRENLPLSDERMRVTLQKSLNDEQRTLGAMVICGSQRVNFEFVEPRVRSLSLEEKPRFKNAECDVYYAIPAVQQSQQP